MSIESFFTVISPAPGQKIQAGQTVLSGGRTGALGTGGLNFLDFILGQLERLEKKTEGNTPEFIEQKSKEALQSDNPLLDKEARLELAKILADNPEIAEQIEQYGLGEYDEITETLALNQQAFDEILKTVKQPISIGKLEIDPANDHVITVGPDGTITCGGSKTVIDIVPVETDTHASKDVNAFLNNLKSLIDQIDENGPAVASSNLTPAQVFDLKQKLYRIIDNQQHIAKSDPQTDGFSTTPKFDGILAILIQLVPPQNKTSISLPTNASGAGQQTASLALNKQEFGLSGRLNGLVTGGGNNAQGFTRGDLPGTENIARNFDKTLKNAAANKANNGGIFTAEIKPVNLFNPPTVTLSLGLMGGDIKTQQGWADDYGSANSLQNVTQLSGMTELVTQARHASQNHPATQMVAATVRKMSSDGLSRNVTLQLDPPELGRVEVRLEFGKDKTVKASILSEKPETHLMLQRDGQMLERILQDAGLDTDGGVNFQLADDGYDFNQNSRNGGNGQGSNGQDTNGDEQDVIETTMSWQVDPQTGHMRYNLMV